MTFSIELNYCWIISTNYTKKEKLVFTKNGLNTSFLWLREADLNHRPTGYHFVPVCGAQNCPTVHSCSPAVLTAAPMVTLCIRFAAFVTIAQRATLAGLITFFAERLAFIKRKKQPTMSIAFYGCGRRIWTTDLRVMSPTSYQTAPSRVINAWTRNWCRKPESNRYGSHLPQDFKSWASASSATPANLSCSSAKI